MAKGIISKDALKLRLLSQWEKHQKDHTWPSIDGDELCIHHDFNCDLCPFVDCIPYWDSKDYESILRILRRW